MELFFQCWNLYWLGFLLRDQYHSIPTKVWQKQRDEEHLSLHHGQHPGDCKNDPGPVKISLVQITEANYKLFHPEIFSSPWVQVTVRGRCLFFIGQGAFYWSCVGVKTCPGCRSRCGRWWGSRGASRRSSRGKLSRESLRRRFPAWWKHFKVEMVMMFFYQRADTKERWKKHIEGDDYVPSPPSASSINRSGGTLLTM